MLKITFTATLCGFIMSCSGLPTNSNSTSGPSGIPQQAIDAAIKLEQDKCNGHKRECKDFKVTCSRELEVTSAANANGAEEKWCVVVKYIYRNGKLDPLGLENMEKWYDGKNAPYDDTTGVAMTRAKGVWKNGEEIGIWCQCRQ